MSKSTARPLNKQLIPNVLRWTALILFLSSLVLPNGIGPENMGIGIGAWLGSLSFAIVMVIWSLGGIIHTVTNGITEWPPPEDSLRFIILWGIPLSGIANFFVLRVMYAWYRPYKWSRFVLLCVAIATQFAVFSFFPLQTMPINDPHHPGPTYITYIGIGYILWVLSFVTLATGMVLKYRWIERPR